MANMDVAADLRERMRHEPCVEFVVLFGSHATGRANRASDVDLGVRWTSGTSVTERSALLARLERSVRATVDAIDLDDAPPLLRIEIAKSGVVVVARTPQAWPQFRARAMLDWWDFAPYARAMHQAARARLAAGDRWYALTSRDRRLTKCVPWCGSEG
ncbi:MAG: nucleotidyltransferase domain-containing protein [Myxococcales bacterium]|nr:nucleotidyltransferase domain-containing protein [Myxococcales bacterium]